MNQMVNLRPRLLPDSCVRVVRKIKGSGSLLVAKNQEVSPHDMLGKSYLSPGFSVLNLSKELKISPQSASNALQKPVGVPIYKGELLARKKSLFGNKDILAPTDCVIEQINQTTGELTLKMLPKQIPLLSGVFGIVDQINTLTGEVYIKTMATQIVGIFGSGRERGGFLRIIGSSADLINASQISNTMRGDIMVAGGLVLGAALKKAMECQIDGLISGGINMDDYLSIAGSLYESHKSHSDIGMSLVAIEGFGPITIGADIFNTLKEFEGKYVFINGFASHLILPASSADAIIKSRKISLPPLNLNLRSHPQEQIIDLKAGLKVRIIWPPFMGNQGIVISVDGSPTQLPSGVSVVCCLVELASRKIKVPVNNVEAI